MYLRGLLFKFVDFLYSRSEVFDTVLKVILSENKFFSLSFDVYLRNKDTQQMKI